MNDHIVCPHCKKQVPLTEAFTHQLEEKYEKEKKAELERYTVHFKKRLEEERQKYEKEQQLTVREMEEKLKEKIRKDVELKLQDSKNEAEELQKQNKVQQEQLLELNKLIRQLKVENDQKRIEMEKKLAEEEEKAKEYLKKQMEDEYHFKLLEKDKKIQDALRVADEYKRKLEQGSQQSQGEVLELEFEELLKREFPADEIKEVPKGVNGADLVHVIRNSYGKQAGTILWEFKRTKAWSNEWTSKLKDDQRVVGADLSILISQTLPANIKCFGLFDGVWVGDFQSALGLAQAMRSQVVKVALIKSAVEGNNEKKDILWNYLTSPQFTHKIQAIADVYNNMREDLEKEKRFFKNKWAKQELSIQKVTDSIYEMHGELEGIMGKSLEEIKGMEMLPVETSSAVEKKIEEPVVQGDGLF